MPLGLASAYGFEALQNLLSQRRAERLQEEQIAFARQQALQQAERQRLMEERQQRVLEDAARQNVFRNFAAESLPNEDVTPELADIVRRQGGGGMLRTIAPVPAQAPSELRPGEQGPPDIGVPAQAGRVVSRGGEKYLAARQAAEERAAQFAATQAAINARAQDQRDFQASENEKYKRTAEQLQAAARGTEQGRPYFQPATEYDAQGRPVGNLSFNARTGTFAPAQLPSGGHLKPPPSDLGKASIVNETALDQLDRLRGMFKPEYVGPFTGRTRAFGQKVPGVPVDEGFANFEAATSAFRNSVIKAITGAQMSEPEANRIRQQIPEVYDKPEVWQAKYEQSKKNLSDLQNRIKNPRFMGAGPQPLSVDDLIREALGR